MFIYQRKQLIYLVTLCSYIYGMLLFVTTTYAIKLYKNNSLQSNHNLVDYLHESEHFQPCIEQSDPIYPTAKMIICREDITSQFGNRLPMIIQSDNNYLISTIHIENNPNIEICTSGTFENIMKNNPNDMTTYHGIIERKLILKGLSLHIFQHGCLKGLSDLDVLYIENYFNGELKKISGNLFQELKNLHNLKSLHLENIDMSIGIPQYAFHGWIKHLKILTMINNNLNRIHNEAFPSDNLENKLLKLRIEQQSGDGWKLLENSHIWAKYLYTLKLFSLDGTNLQMTIGKTLSSSISDATNIKSIETSLNLHLGDYVNKNLEQLNIQNCGLTNLIDNNDNKDLSSLNLFHLGNQLKQLYIGFNQFPNFNFINAIKKFHNLQLLSINSNQIPLEKLPESFSIQWPYLKELQITSIGINNIPMNSISNHLQILHLSENPLELFNDHWIQLNDHSNINEVQLNELHLNSIRLISVQLENGQANWEKIFQPIKNSIEHLSLINCQLEANMFIKSIYHPKNQHSNYTIQENVNKQIYLNLGLTHLKQLKSLILSGNYLEYIPPGLFENLNKLNSLVLTQNQLLTIQEYKIENDIEEDYISKDEMNHLLRLDLSYNLLITMERCAYALGFKKPFESIIPLKPTWFIEKEYYHDKQELSTDNVNDDIHESNQIYWLGGLNIIGNPFVCDCRLAWFRYFISQMSKQFIKSEQLQKQEEFITTTNIPFGFQKYLNEAINFTCYGINQWTGRNFLTLTPNDLYMEEHIDCKIRPDIYGKDMKSLETLKPCWKLNKTQSPNLEEILQTRQEMIFRTGVKNTLYGSPSIILENATTISNEAYTLIILAGIAALCFIIISVIIIIWLCIRLKRNTHHKHIISSSVKHRKLFNRRLNKVSESFKKFECYSLSPSCNLFTSCSNCTNNKRQQCLFCGCTMQHLPCISSTNETSHQLMRPKSHRREDSNETQNSIFANHANNVQNLNNERIPSSIYSEMTDVETQSLNRFININNTDKKSVFKSKTQRNRDRKRSHIIESNRASECSDDGKKSILQVRKNSQPDLSVNSHLRGRKSQRSTYIDGKPLQASASVQTLLQIDNNQSVRALRQPFDALLPPLPAPRKSKSIGDLHQNTRIESPTHLSTGMMSFNLRRSAKQLAMKKMEEQSMQQPTEAPVYLLRHYDTKKKRSPVSVDSIRRSALPWRDKSLDNSDFASIKAGKSILTSSRTSLKGVFRRTRLIVSARARLENNEKSNINLRNNWLSASRRKIEQTCKWLKRDRMFKRDSHPLSTPTQPKPRQVHSESDVKFLGPELPKPFFLLPKEPEYATPFIEPQQIKHTDYLPMYHDKSMILSSDETTTELLSNQMKSITKKSPIDEYVTDLIHIEPINYPNMILMNPFNSTPQQQPTPIASVKPPPTNTLNTINNNSTSTLPHPTSSNQPTGINNNNNNRPIRPPRHQKLKITGDNTYSIQTFSDNKNDNKSKNNNPTRGSELNKNKKSDKYWPLDYELPLPPPPPPPPPFILNNKPKLIKSNGNKILLSNIESNEDNTEVNNNANSSSFHSSSPPFSTLTLQPSLKSKTINVKPLRSARFPQSAATMMKEDNHSKLNFTTEQNSNNNNNNNNNTVNNTNYKLIEKALKKPTPNK
ncbi:unnamed protein product [Schistosoma rodhaini]|uniref:LRRCT domain-containing protein n=1 Tax=Schistosoma rodhaini TaxID=6188 RepID=A0AA85EXC7_9TREM|nr:unnamed protein product [Schistosoma rodhaini]